MTSDTQNLLKDLESLVKKHSALALEKKNTDSVLKSLQVIDLSVKIVSNLKKLYSPEPDSDFLFSAIADSVSGRIVRSELWIAYTRLSTHYGVAPYRKCEFFRRLLIEKNFTLMRSGVSYFVPPGSPRIICSAFLVEKSTKNLLSQGYVSKSSEAPLNFISN
jgi:hypothetical protein